MQYGPNGKSLGSATVIFNRPEQATKATTALNGVKIDNRPIRVDLLLSAANVPPPTKQSSLADRVTYVRTAPSIRFLLTVVDNRRKISLSLQLLPRLLLPPAKDEVRVLVAVAVVVAAAASVRRRRPSRSLTPRWPTTSLPLREVTMPWSVTVLRPHRLPPEATPPWTMRCSEQLDPSRALDDSFLFLYINPASSDSWFTSRYSWVYFFRSFCLETLS